LVIGSLIPVLADATGDPQQVFLSAMQYSNKLGRLHKILKIHKI